jgi:hypothetical protein
MVAIVTDSLRAQLSAYLFDEMVNSTDSNEYYVGIGKTDTYDSSDTIATPLRHTFEDRNTRGNLESIKKVADTSFVVTRNNWSSGTIYSAYNDKQVGYPTNPYYVITEDNEVYICLQQSKSTTGSANPSTVKPSFGDAGVTQIQAFETSDGYRWKLLYAISAGEATNFLTSGFMPVAKVTVDSSLANATELQQIRIQQEAPNIKGQIVGVEVVDGGSGYTSAPTLTFRGNGTNAAATATISGGAITKVEMNNDSAALGTNYDYASINQSGGGSTNATLRPIIGPRDGFGADARNDLKSSSVMVASTPDGTESNTFNITNDFRQIALFRNLDSSGGRVTDGSAKVNRMLTVTTDISTTGFAVDEVITGGTSGVTALIDEVDSNDGNIIRFHQNEKTKNGNFQDGEALTGSLGGSGTIDSATSALASDVDIYSGDLLYIENRARIIRSSAQSEAIKIIITV